MNNSPFGKGIVATKKIQKGEIICKFMGPIITLKEFFDKYDFNGCNVLQIGEDAYIDVIEPFLFFNHSCLPNSGVRNNGILFALKDIEIGSEIFFDYSTTADDVIWSMECKCLSTECRKTIGDYLTIPHARREYYLKENALTSYIKSIYY